MSKNEELYHFKILYSLGIIMVVAMHCKRGGIDLGWKWFEWNAFLLGIFIFSSGYFFTRNYEKKATTIIWKKIKKLIIPFFCWNIFYGILVFVLKNIGIIKYSVSNLNFDGLFIKPIYDGQQFRLNSPSWFIVPFFCVQIFSVLFLPILKKKKGVYIVCCIYLVLGMIGARLNMLGYNSGWWLALTRTLYFLPFFAVGILYKEKLEKYDVASNTVYFCVLIVLKLISLYYYDGNEPDYIPISGEGFDNMISPFILGFLGIAFWFRISKILVPSLKNSKIVNILSKNTFSIMMHHKLGFLILNLIWIPISGIFSNKFNFEEFQKNSMYVYLPKNIENFEILYLVFGIGWSLIMVYIINKIKYPLLKKWEEIRDNKFIKNEEISKI